MYGRIVVGVAKTESGKRAADVAIDLAKQFGAELHLVMAFDRAGKSLESQVRKDAEGFLEAVQARATVPMHLHAIPGDPADTVVMVAREVEADLVVVGNRGMHGGARRILGSVPSTIAHNAPCSVLIADTTA